jgi:Domain of unknown function (DUF397)
MQPLSAPWRKSSYSTNGGQSCLEAASASGEVLIRDTTDRERGPVLRLTPRAFADLTTRIRKDTAL